ncbi:hypothetical protein TNCV_4965111 [Trichonephila clavipes]|nr:hypothetical protein TNCV_4965111 [Trichonephila clavipes]
MIGESRGSAPSIFCLGLNSIGSLRQKDIVIEIIYVSVLRKPYGRSCHFGTEYPPGYFFLTTGQHSFHSSISWSTCAKERRNS